MSWREDVKFGIIRADQIYYGTANGGMGTELSTTELAFLDGITAGTVTASKALVVDASKDLSALRTLGLVNLDAGSSGVAGTVDVFPTTASKGKFTLTCTDQDGDTVVTLKPAAMGQNSAISIPDPGAATANVLLTDAANDGAVVTATAPELNVLDNIVGPTVTLTSETGGSGTCAVQVVFNDVAGNPMANIVSGTVYFSDSATGLTIDGVDTSVAVLTNGALQELDDVGHSVFQYVSDAAGLLGFTITSAAASYYACFPQPDGSVTVVGPLICDA